MKAAAAIFVLALVLGVGAAVLFPKPGIINSYRSTPLGGSGTSSTETNNQPGGPDWQLGTLLAGGAFLLGEGLWIALRRRGPS